MNLNIYSIFDLKTGQFGTPFAMMNDETAKRAFLDSLAEVRVPTMISKFPEDYSLYRICDFDSVSGEVQFSRPTFVANAGTFGDKLAAMIKSNRDLLASINRLVEKEDNHD